MKLRYIVLMLPLCLATIAQAGPFVDEMSKCLVRKTSETDKVLLVQWIYAAMSSHPDVKAMSRIDSERAAAINKDAANMIMELLTERCKTETQQAIKFEGEASFQTSFEVLGSVAMQGLMTNPEVAKYIAGLSTHFDEEKLKKAFEVE